MNTDVRYGSERGAVLIQVAIAILSLTAFSTFVIDYGVLWVARNQAQNAADAGALAGAIARGYDEFTDPPASGGKAELSARWAALCASGSADCPATPYRQTPSGPRKQEPLRTVDVLWDCPPTFAGRCVQVNVYRDGTSARTRRFRSSWARFLASRRRACERLPRPASQPATPCRACGRGQSPTNGPRS